MRRLGVTFGAYAPIVPADRAVGYLDGEDGYPSSAGRVHLAFSLGPGLLATRSSAVPP